MARGRQMDPAEVDLERLARELRDAAPVRSQIPAFEAYALAAALQLAWRHPGLSPAQSSIVEKAGRDLQAAIASRSAYAAETLELGWRREHDVGQTDGGAALR